ncbi:MAG: hypothetical protein V1875_05535 [Candidatus Altiarchaeota archaeon]
MKVSRWELNAGIILVVMMVCLYGLHFLVFKDVRGEGFLIVNDLAFLPIQILLVSLVLERLLNERQKQERMEKLNMIIGVFFSEVGTKLLTYLSDHDPNLETIKGDLVVGKDWTEEEFNKTSNKLKGYKYGIDIEKIDMEQLRCFLLSKRDFMLRLSENPNLLEHETFTELLRAAFHLTEEFGQRGILSGIPPKDREHLAGDVKRIYGLIVLEWISYMNHLRQNYPYMFSFAMRTNPFDRKASATICE